MNHLSKSPAETQRIAADFIKTIVKEGRLTQGPVIIGLTGDLGTGKTVFVQGLAKGLGIDPKHYVNSPTFTLVNEYEGPSVKLIHVDLYRIERPLEIETLGLDDFWRPHHIIAVEWVEKAPDFEKYLDFQVHLTNISPTERKIEILAC